MQVCFVLYNNSGNSAFQVHNFASALTRKGHRCVVVVPDDSSQLIRDVAGANEYAVHTCAEIKENHSDIFSSSGLDILHAWTPREKVRRMTGFLSNLYRNAPVIVHLEDNEELILEKFFGITARSIRNKIRYRFLSVEPDFSHPVYYKKFLSRSAGVSVIIDRLREFVPARKPSLELWPIVDFSQFYPREKNIAKLRELGVDESETVLCYTGNVHPANVDEVRELYRAVGRANRSGFPVRLIRTGRDFTPVLSDEDSWIKQFVKELGYIESVRQIPEILALADILIQPGKPDPFNDFRLPSKLPEFLAMGKPVVLPETNLALAMEEGVHALFLRTGTAMEIFDQLVRLIRDEDLRNTLAKNGFEFARTFFDETRIVTGLEKFYSEVRGAASV